MPDSLKVVLKFIWYLFSRLFLWAIAIGLVVLAFFMAMDYMNVQTLTKDGMQVRAGVIIKGDDPSTLSKVFSKSFLEQDEMLNSDVYRQYKVSDFDYKVDVGFALIFPWQNTVTIRVTETVSDIDAQTYATTDDSENEPPPSWQNAVYDVTLVRYEDNWRVVSMDMVEALPSPSPSESPSESPSPSPSESPSEITTGEIIED